MTKQSTEALIAESREVARQYDPAFRFVLERVIDRLESVAKDSSEGQYQHAYWQQRAEEAERERDHLAAVVEKVRSIIAETCCGEDTMCEHDEHIWADFYGEKVSDIDIALDAATPDVLRERDAAVIEGLADEVGYSLVHHEEAEAFLLREARQLREEKS